MKYAFVTAEGRLYAEGTPNIAEYLNPDFPAEVKETYNAAFYRRPEETAPEPPHILIFDADTREEAEAIAERLKAYETFTNLYRTQEYKKWTEGKPTDTEKYVMQQYQKGKQK